MEIKPSLKQLGAIMAEHANLAEAALVFDLINGRQTPSGVVQTMIQQNHFQEDLSERLEKLQSLILDLATDVPFTHAPLVALLNAFRTCSNKDVYTGIWGTFGMHEGDLHSALMHNDEQAAEYININGFEAQLWRAMGSEVEDYLYSYPINSYARSIEQQNPKEEFQTMDGEVAAACLWMIHGSERIWKLTKEADHESGGKDWRGDLWKGEQGYSVERWELWKKRFQDVADGKVEKVGAETKRLAVAAVTNMTAVVHSN